MPCLQAFALTARFPRSDLGPVDALAFLRLMALRSSGDSFIAVQLPVVVESEEGARSIGGSRPSFSYHRESQRDRSHDPGILTARPPPGVGWGGSCRREGPGLLSSLVTPSSLAS